MIVISGITSSIGLCLAKYLVALKIPVVGFSRKATQAKALFSHPLLQLHNVDLHDQKQIEVLCKGAEGIVHLAARSTPWGKWDDFYKVNVQGTASILKAASRCAVTRLIHLSTPSIYFEFKDRFAIAESDPLPAKNVNAYSRTKKMAEDLVDSSEVPSITLRPRAIFGPHDQVLLPRILKTCRQRGILQLRRRSPITDITYVENVAHAIALALQAPRCCVGQKYNITNGEPMPLIEVLECFCSQLSIPIQRKYFPFPIAYALAFLAELQGKVLQKEPLITRYGVGVLAYSQTLSIKKAQQELQYNPKVSLKEGIKRYAQWLHSH